MTSSPWNRDEDYDTVVKSEKGSYDLVGCIGLLGWYRSSITVVSQIRGTRLYIQDEVVSLLRKEVKERDYVASQVVEASLSLAGLG